MYFVCLNFIPAHQGDHRVKGLLVKSQANNTAFKGLKAFGSIEDNQKNKFNLYGSIENFYKYKMGFTLDELGENQTDITSYFSTNGRILDMRPCTHFMTLFTNGDIVSFIPNKTTNKQYTITKEQILSASQRNTLELYNNVFPTEKLTTISHYLNNYIVFKEIDTIYGFLDTVNYSNVLYNIVSRELINEVIQYIAVAYTNETSDTYATNPNAPPIGASYFQIVGKHVEPHILYPNTVWEKLYSGDSVVLRTDGTLANENRQTNGIQDYATKRSRGQAGESWEYGINGDFYPEDVITTLATGGGFLLAKVFYDNSRSGNTSENETRMRNVLCNMWIRVV